ncbi:hypothetical protein LMG9673_01230 [Ralstonia pseudosolanacearum]|nr:hypothetical protein LMG9673_01230 [Ralstonia pseudosolanacearum]
MTIPMLTRIDFTGNGVVRDTESLSAHHGCDLLSEKIKKLAAASTQAAMPP